MAFYEHTFIGKQDLSNKEIDNLVDKYSKIIQENKHRPVSQPKVDFKNEKDDMSDNDKVFKIEFELFQMGKRT